MNFAAKVGLEPNLPDAALCTKGAEQQKADIVIRGCGTKTDFIQVIPKVSDAVTAKNQSKFY